MNIKKLIALVLLLFCFVLSFASCKGSEDDSKNTGTPSIPDPILYEEYLAMTPEERADYYYAFENYEDFFTWYNAAKAKYDEEHKAPEIGEDGEINIDDFIGGN